MDTLNLRSLILNCPLKEEAVPTIAGWEGANLIIRELSAKAGSELLSSCSNADGKVDQQALLAGIIIATLRNADDPAKTLVFGIDGQDEANPVYRDQLMATGLGRIMEVAKLSIHLSGLDDQTAVPDAKNASSATVSASSPTTSQAA